MRATKKQTTAKASNGGDVHIGQILYGSLGTKNTVTAIDGDNVSIEQEGGRKFIVTLAQIRTDEDAGLVGTSQPAIMAALGDQDDE